MSGEIKSFCEENRISLFVVFGSWARKETHPRSDIDIAVVPEDSDSVVDKLKLICSLESIFERPVDLTVVTKDTDPLLGFEIFFRGKPLYEKTDGLFEKQKLAAWKKYLDTEKIRKMERDFVEKYIRELKNVS